MQTLGKTDVTIGDRAGFIANALLFGYLNHAVSLFESHYATREDIDAAMKLGCGLPMGPLALLDLIGIDTAYEILDTMYGQCRDRLHAPQPIFKQMMTAGLLGRKTGRGFYTYEASDSPEVVADELTPPAHPELEGVRDVSKVGVVGSGTMATGIVEVFAKAGYDVTFVARSGEKADKVVGAVTRSLDKAVGRGKLAEDERDAALGRITASTSLDDLAGVQLVVEAVVEDLHVKQTLFANLDDICAPGTVLATTTSSLPVIECATATSRPGDVIGMHFFNPAAIMRLVEVVHTVSTAPTSMATVLDVTAKVEQARGALRRPRRLHRQRAAVPVPQRRDQDARGALRDRRRHRLGDEGRLRLPDGPVRAARRRRQRRVAGDRARAVPGVPRARVRAGAAARAPRHRRAAGPQDRQGLPRLSEPQEQAANGGTGARRAAAGPPSHVVTRVDRAVARHRLRTSRPVTGQAAVKQYRCPGCDQLTRPGQPHVVAWPAHDLDADDRRHWHTACWSARDTRGPGVQRSRSAPRY